MVPSIYRIGFLLIVLRFLLITPSNKSIGFLSSYQYQILDPFRTMTSSICYSLCTMYYMLFDNHSVTHLEDFSSVVGVSSPLCRPQLLGVYLALFVMYSFSCRCCLFGIIAPLVLLPLWYYCPLVLLAPSGLQVVVVWGFLAPSHVLCSTAACSLNHLCKIVYHGHTTKCDVQSWFSNLEYVFPR